VTSIGSSAFFSCIGLTSVNIPNNVTSIGSSAFEGCTGLTSVTISNSVTSISDKVFRGCTGLTSVTIPNSVTFIGDSAFEGCTGLTSVNIGNRVTDIGDQSFYRCSNLTSITIPNSVIYIGYSSFQYCSALTSVNIGFDVFMSISNLAFANCEDLTDVFCLAEKISKVDPYDSADDIEGFYTSPSAFNDSYPQAITLHVPAGSVEAYRSREPWNQFKAILALENVDNPEIKKCATPEITYANGKVSLSCETEGVEFISEVTVADAKKYYDSEFTLSQTYKITVYATKAGYENSDVATREIVIENGQTTLFGDTNKDGNVNVTDVVKLIDIILNK
jgi:hypothetical protein